MTYIVKIGTTYIDHIDISEGVPIGYVLAPTPLPDEPYIWDAAIENIRAKNSNELLEDNRDTKIKELKEEGRRRANLVYEDEVFQNIGEVKLFIDIENTYDRSGAIAPRLLELNQLLTVVGTETPIIKVLDQIGLDNYDVAINPGWPI
jgi:hypothetical protein